MGEPNNHHHHHYPLLPPGFRFYPSDQQLLCFYLTTKNNPNLQFPNLQIPNLPNPNPYLLIQELDLYNSDPSDLPETASFPFGHGGTKKHWYCFTVRVRGGEGLRRKAKGGVWRRKGPVRNVLCGDEGDDVVMGTKIKFVFYRRDSSARRGWVKTDWVMFEYALLDHSQDSFVLCRVFLKPCNVAKTVEVVRNCYSEENNAVTQKSSTPLHSLKHGGASTLDIAEAARRETSVDVKNVVEKFPAKSIPEPNDKVVARPDDDVGSFWDIQSFDQPVKSSSWYTGGQFTLEDFMSDELRVNTAILEEDYLELNDLVGPLVCPYS